MPTKWFSENTEQGRRERYEGLGGIPDSNTVVIDTAEYNDNEDTEYESDYITERNRVYCEHCRFKLEKRVSRYYCKHCNVYFKIKSESSNKNSKKTKLDMPQDPTNKEHNVAYPDDPLDEYNGNNNNKNKPSGFFAESVVSPTGTWTEITESNPKTGTTYSYRAKSNSTIRRGTPSITSKGKGAPKPVITEGSSIGNVLDSQIKNMTELKRKGRVVTSS